MIFPVTEKELLIGYVLGREYLAAEGTQQISASPLP